MIKKQVDLPEDKSIAGLLEMTTEFEKAAILKKIPEAKEFEVR